MSVDVFSRNTFARCPKVRRLLSKAGFDTGETGGVRFYVRCLVTSVRGEATDKGCELLDAPSRALSSRLCVSLMPERRALILGSSTIAGVFVVANSERVFNNTDVSVRISNDSERIKKINKIRICKQESSHEPPEAARLQVSSRIQPRAFAIGKLRL